MQRLVAGLGGIGLAVAFSQFPEYAQQYTQRLGGAVDELSIITEEFDRAAITGGLTREQALDRYSLSDDSFLTDRGMSMVATFQRYELLRETLSRIQDADPVQRFRSLSAYLDNEIGRRTLENYKPAVPVTMEAILYAGAGCILGYLFVSCLWRFCALPFRRRRHPMP